MSAQIDIGEMVEIITKQDPTLGKIIETQIVSMAFQMATVICANQNAAEPDNKIICSDLKDIVAWGGRIMVGFRPEDGNYEKPVPSAIAGYDDEGWE